MLATGTFASGKHAGGHAEANIGVVGVAANVTRTVAVDMGDTMRFTPAAIQVEQGETIRFVIKNSGQLKHEFVLGSAQALKEHYELMKKHPAMEHADDNMLTVLPGQTGEMLWQFTQAGTVGFACLQEGHYDAGMKGAVSVNAGMTRGEVRKVDVAAQKITLKHADIKNLDMPAMTMVFRVQSPALLAQVKVGDQVNFNVIQREGALVVTAIEAAK